MLVHKQTSATAAVYGLKDRGVLAKGMKADINVIDFAALDLIAPEVAYDLPTGGRRLLQRATVIGIRLCLALRSFAMTN